MSIREVRMGTFVAAMAFVRCTGSQSGGETGGDTMDALINDVAADTTRPVDATHPPDASIDAPTPDALDVVDGSPDSPPDVVIDVPTDGAAPFAIAVPCADTIANVYVTPTGLAPLASTSHGDIVRCAHDVTYAMTDVQTQLTGASATGVTAANAVDIYRVMYRTQRGNGNDGTSSARVYVPLGVTAPSAVIVIGHPSNGLADSCAPSMSATSLQNLALPFAANGYAVIAPDYAGLGTETTQGYLDNRDTGQTMLDGARALRKFLAPGSVTSQIAMVGHSQGGGAVLSAQSLASTYGADGSLDAVAVFAAEWETRLNSFQFVTALQAPTSLTITFGVTTPVVVDSEAYAWWENYVGAGDGSEVFPAATSAGTVSALNADCLVEFGGYQQATALHVGDWLDDTLRTTFLACVADPTSAGCTAPGSTLYEHMSGNILTGDPTGPAVVYIQGSSDIIMPPAQEAACNIDKLRTDGVAVQVCVDSGASHTSVVGDEIGFAMHWVAARLAGAAVPACSAAGFPACTP